MATVTLTGVDADGFGDLSASEAERILYERVVPACEAKRVHLTDSGNVTAPNATCNVTQVEYETRKKGRRLLDVEAVQMAFDTLPDLIEKAKTYKISSYGLHRQVAAANDGAFVSSGATIAAMLLLGHAARFGTRGGPRDVNAEFKARTQ